MSTYEIEIAFMQQLLHIILRIPGLFEATMYVSDNFRSSTGLFLQERGIKWAVEPMGVRCKIYKLFCWLD
jgi:hypothetical protein